MATPDGGPAFPQFEDAEEFDDDRGAWVKKILPTGGMSLRDYFAAAALTGLQQWDALMNQPGGQSAFLGSEGINKMATVAYKVADAMLNARAQ